jgi:hypothetical protein
MHRAHAAALVAALLAGGCAATANRPPTPAARLTGAELDQFPRSADDRYFLIVFGSESVPRRPKYTHSWATVARATGGRVVEAHTISWLPAKVDIEPLRFTVEPGANFDLCATLKIVRDTDQKIALWGPYEIGHRLYHRFQVQKAFLESGAIGYQCIDNVGEAARNGNGCDCIHAVTDMDPIYDRARYPLAFYGQAASKNLVGRIMRSPVVIDPPRTHDWVIAQLGLDGYPIRQREYRGRTVPYEPGSTGDLTAPPRPPLPVPVPRPPAPADTPAPPPGSPPEAPPAAPAVPPKKS